MKYKILVSIVCVFCFSSMHLRADFEIKAMHALELHEVHSFIEEMANKHQYDRNKLLTWFEHTQIQPGVIQAITKPYEALPWYKYQKLFNTPEHIQNGITFWHKHAQTLQKAQEQFGVPPEIIVAILGVETRYGERKGQYLVLDALTTLAFRYPPRAKFFLSELEQFLLLVREQNLDPTTIFGSYAGAMGVPQFISSSYRHYAVDFSGNGNSDLFNNIEDAIGSVANYFKKHGWQKNQLIAISAHKKENFQPIEILNDPKPTYDLKNLAKIGIEPLTHLDEIEQQKMALLTFDEEQGSIYWLGFNNFYVITRYNHSPHYAMAVFQLANKIKQVYEMRIQMDKV